MLSIHPLRMHSNPAKDVQVGAAKAAEAQNNLILTERHGKLRLRSNLLPSLSTKPMDFSFSE